MKRKIIDHLRGYFDRDFRKKLDETDSAKKLLKKLKKRRKELEEKQKKDSSGKEGKRRAKQIDILRKQEKRAVQLVRKQKD